MKKPSVTELINLLNKPALLKWSNDIGLRGIKLEDYRKKSTFNGISIHKQIQEFVLTGKEFQDKNIQDVFERFILDKKIIGIEKNIENEYLQGRYDVKLEYQNKIWICDFKSSGRLYFENYLQLSAYAMCEKDCSIAIVQVPEFIFKPINIDLIKYQQILKALNIIYKLKLEL